MTTSTDERVRIREQIDRLRGLLEAMEISLGMSARPPLSETAAAIADAGIRLVATAGRHDAYQRAEADLAIERKYSIRLRALLEEMTKARDEACDLADDYQLGVTRGEYGWSTRDRVARIAELRRVGGDK